MFVFCSKLKVHLVLLDVSMNSSVNGLSSIVSGELNKDPFSGDLFVFCNRSRDLIKILYWEDNGFCLWRKRLEEHKFPWPRKGGVCIEISHRSLRWLLEGLSIHQQQAYPSLDFSMVF